ncbi:hypothetical protein EZS27_002071 [termite gut metagenome]|uniref:Uncharacterized protein n=1 Tax=termite gut metagenome TaxID=433724 RepID=A0A5J4SXI3_9ZZZZ
MYQTSHLLYTIRELSYVGKWGNRQDRRRNADGIQSQIYGYKFYILRHFKKSTQQIVTILADIKKTYTFARKTCKYTLIHKGI